METILLTVKNNCSHIDFLDVFCQQKTAFGGRDFSNGIIGFSLKSFENGIQ